LFEIAEHVAKMTGLDPEQIRTALAGKATPAHENANIIRAKVTDAILSSGKVVRDAALQVLTNHDPKAAGDWLVEITKGEQAKVLKELGGVPLYDTHILSLIESKNHELSGEATCNMASRALSVGTTTRPGSYRHELGHAIRSAWGGKSWTGKTAMTAAAAKEFEIVQEKLKADPSGIKTKLTHEEYETKYGVAGRRSLDNWEENVAEHYRLYHREIYRDLHEGGNGKHLAQYRERHPGWAKIWDAHYTAALLGHGG